MIVKSIGSGSGGGRGSDVRESGNSSSRWW